MEAVVEQGRVKQWGNSLALRLPSGIAKAAGLEEDTPVKITAADGQVVIEPVRRRMTLSERLAKFDPKRHGGDLMDSAPTGGELF
jgi:antitoxin MazE